MSDSSLAAETATEIIEHIIKEVEDLPVVDRMMVLGYVAEHCKAHVQTVLAHDYHAVLYPRKGAE